ncbi:MAG: O-linked N-acetylglucosamine transferase, SPINDLY family protein [Synechococcales cyanobacterium C42_A2020_086]|jgi:predicted O-linked N-acetylglucosamine transferase (SPINDLY family)|nr:O-linked N-acetylglucosamine transferase, SPINDLY family protein [Synechococcales cyanobacterium C42_A2020_086]
MISGSPIELQQQAAAALQNGNYTSAIQHYEALIAAQPQERGHYWHLGLAYLLQGEEAAAQMTWLLVLADANESDAALWTAELAQLLESEAHRQMDAGRLDRAWGLWHHRHQLNPLDATPLLQALQVALHDEGLLEMTLLHSELIEALQAAAPQSLDHELVMEVLSALLAKNLPHPVILEVVSACLPQVQHYGPHRQCLLPLLRQCAEHLGYTVKDRALACRYGEICLQLAPRDAATLSLLAYLYPFTQEYDKAIECARQSYGLAETAEEKLLGHALLLRTLIHAGNHWPEAALLFEQQHTLLREWLQSGLLNPEAPPSLALLTSSFFPFPYLADAPQIQRSLQNQVAQRCQAGIEAHLAQQLGADYRTQLFPLRSRLPSTRMLRIAYLSGHFRRHSIGWLSRWLFQHHDPERFEVYAYFLQSPVDDFGQRWFVDWATRACCFEGHVQGIAQAIYEDEIDILIDVDTVSSQPACAVMALKPAPVQVSWLGLDASGLPAIDYFLADPYVLPESAQDYYQERIWRLPHTYIAVDGFEVGTPTLRRDHLGIPGDAVIYFSAQAAFKRHPDTVRAQMRILKSVPHSYFLIKGVGDQAAMQQFFVDLAASEGVSPDRLRFLPIVESEETHRANLAIADVVLDTYPYNGATTTLETLWMGVPLVTRVGQQFTARNSYTMMINAGITEGIAWTEEEYVNWGIRLGMDPALRQQISWRLKRSRQTAPLWNARQFTRDIEAAYEQMWQQRGQH